MRRKNRSKQTFFNDEIINMYTLWLWLCLRLITRVISWNDQFSFPSQTLICSLIHSWFHSSLSKSSYYMINYIISCTRRDW